MKARISSAWLGNCGAIILSTVVLGGCTQQSVLIPTEQRQVIDRSLVERPTGFELKLVVRDLTAPTAIAFDQEGTLFIADNGTSREPRIFGYKTDGSVVDISPRTVKLSLGFTRKTNGITGPVGGMVVVNGRIYVAHRDGNQRGAITSFDYEGNSKTIVADLPAEGDYGITDLVYNRVDGRLYFGLGSMTNSGVVGLDNWECGWVDKYAEACDVPAAPVKLLGYRFDTSNPRQTLFSGKDIAVTAPFQPFGVSNQMWVRPAVTGRPTAAVYSVNANGGDLRLEAHGIRCPRGLAFNDFGRLYATNQGMEMRGTRPVQNDPDTLLRIIHNTWYGWPDFSADLMPITDPRFQPPSEMIIQTGYPELSNLIDHQASGLMRPDRSTLLQGTFEPLSGAAKMDFVPAAGAFRGFYGSVIIALAGDRAPFANHGEALEQPVGYKVVQVDVDTQRMHDFVFNANRLPAAETEVCTPRLCRPYDVKFAPDGSLYILDLGQIDTRDGRMRPLGHTGKILRLEAVAP